MPTGYTDKIKDGITFQEFAMNCARAFGACLSMRDDPTSTPIPEEFEPSPYHAEQLEKAVQEVDDFNNLTDRQLQHMFKQCVSDGIKRQSTYIKEKNELREKYEEMLDKVHQFEPPTSEHTEYKNFMINQITESIKFDCNNKYDEELIEDLEKMTFDEWYENQVEVLNRAVEYHMEQKEKEEKRCLDRSMWVIELREAIMEVE